MLRRMYVFRYDCKRYFPWETEPPSNLRSSRGFGEVIEQILFENTMIPLRGMGAPALSVSIHLPKTKRF